VAMIYEFNVNWSKSSEVLAFIRELPPNGEVYSRRLMKLFAKHFGYTRSLFFPCMNEPVYCETQTRWAALSNAVVMNVGTSAMRRYSEYYFKKDIFAPSNATREQSQLKFMRIKDLMPYEKFKQTEYYEFIISTGNSYQANLVLKTPDGRNTAYLAFFHTEEEGEFTDEEVEICSFLSDYISPLYLNEIRSSTFVSIYPMLNLMMEDLSIGVALVDNRAMLLWANHKAREYGDLFADSKKDYILKNVFFIGEENLPLQQLINETGQRLINEKITKVSTSIGGTFTFYSRPFSVENVTGNIENRIIVFIVREGRIEGDAFGRLLSTLTARENEILELICSGRTNKEMMEQMNISMFTVRTHIANIYKKLGVGNKATLLVRMNRK